MTARALSSVLFKVRKRWHRSLFRLAARFGWAVVGSTYGIRLAANYADATFRYYVRGSYGPFYWDRLRRIEAPFIFVDIGANQGLYAITAAKNGHAVAVYAFEPVRQTFAYLTRNVALNGVAATCVLVDKGVSDRPGPATMATTAGHSGGATLAPSNEASRSQTAATDIELIDARGLDSLVAAGDAPIIVKIDVEGHEPVVLQQVLAARLSARITEIFLEVDERWVDVGRIRAALSAHGFDRFTRIGTGHHYDLLAERSGRSDRLYRCGLKVRLQYHTSLVLLAGIRPTGAVQRPGDEERTDARPTDLPSDWGDFGAGPRPCPAACAGVRLDHRRA